MVEHYITLFDSGFLPQGLALHASIRRHQPDARLWIIAMDEAASTALRRLSLANVTVLDLPDVENDRLRAVKGGRTRGEYCWTLTPFTPDIVFASDDTAERATYLDADLWFVRDPSPILAELDSSAASVLITDHAYAPEHAQAIRWGRYCVQFMPFTRGSGDDVLTWWQDRVIEWCFNRLEGDRFGDQKYLDDWPRRFPDQVHVLANEAATQAPWNATRFDPSDALVYHFHGLRTMTPDRVRLGHYRIPDATVDAIYRPYLADLSAGLSALAAVGIEPPVQAPPRGWWQETKEQLALRVLDRTPPRSPLTMRLPGVSASTPG